MRRKVFLSAAGFVGNHPPCRVRSGDSKRGTDEHDHTKAKHERLGNVDAKDFHCAVIEMRWQLEPTEPDQVGLNGGENFAAKMQTSK